MLMQRPHRFLPAPPMSQRLSPVYQNNVNLMLLEQERLEQVPSSYVSISAGEFLRHFYIECWKFSVITVEIKLV
jgi:hypothetical protein